MKAGENNIMITAANDRYFNYLLEMLESSNPRDLMIGVLDLGLSAANKRSIRHICKARCEIVDPGWRIPLHNVRSTPPYKKVFLAKPFLSEIFPGFSKYIWVDSDIWFQDCSALNDYLLAADQNGMAICYEDHPAYNSAPKSRLAAFHQRLRSATRENYKSKRIRQYFGQKMAHLWGDTPVMNSGIFCITSGSPAWQHWQDMIKRANLLGQERKRLICDQTCLDLAVSMNKTPHTIMPATHNWLICRAQPATHPESGALVDPINPSENIKVLHYAGSLKRDVCSRQTSAKAATKPVHRPFVIASSPKPLALN